MDFKKITDLFDEVSKKQLKVAAWMLIIAIVFTSGVVTGGLSANKPITLDGSISSELNVDAPASQTPATPSVGQPSEQSSGGNAGGSPSQGTAGDNGASGENSGEMSKAEIVELFNTGANKVKTDAVKVTKNFEDRTHMEEHLILPSVLESMANDLMAEAFKDDTEPIVYATKEEIIANYQVPGQTWVSQLTEAEVMEATVNDNGTEYEIHIKLNPTTNPEPGVGVAKAFDTITAEEVKAKAPSILKDFTTEYFDCVIECKIDKATGRMTWANYDSPLILKLKVEFFGSLDAQVGLRFEKDYTIEY